MSFMSSRGTDSTDAAIHYAGTHARDPAVRALLESIGDPKALSAWAPPIDWRRFKGIMPLLMKLVAYGVDTDENLALLFGPHAGAMRRSLAEARMYAGAMPGSPAHAVRSSYAMQTQKELAASFQRCNVCGKSEEDDLVTLLRCSACKRARYCSPECQRRGWMAHKPECLAARKLEVPIEVKEAADAALDAEFEESRMEHEQSMKETIAKEMASFVSGSTSHDSDGKRRTRDLPWCGEEILEDAAKQLGLETERCNFIVAPPGVKPPNGAAVRRAISFRGKSKSMIVCYTRLFTEQEHDRVLHSPVYWAR